ncbi:MAG: PCRF domain-containing protein, partial [Desulfatiglandales bacterium]
MSSPDFWTRHQEEIQRINQERSRLLEKIQAWTRLKRELEEAKVLTELALEEEDLPSLTEASNLVKSLKRDVQGLTLRAIMEDPEDKLNAIVAINAGTGGTDAQDWCQILFRMYTRWAERNHMEVQVNDILSGDEAGIKNVTFTVIGPYAYGFLKAENGIHRL